jgi:peptidoglycan-associated lipoprotein
MTTTPRWIGLSLIAALAACSHAAPPAVAAAPAPDSTAIKAQSRAREDSIARAEAARAAEAQHRADSIAAAQRRAADAEAALGTTLHFDYNKSEIRPEDIALLDAKLAILRASPSARIRIAGNCDERGSDEYNLALGNRRAIAARQYLVDRGIDPSRIETTSYGEEKPVDPGHDEAAWAKNRNDQFSLLSAVVF